MIKKDDLLTLTEQQIEDATAAGIAKGFGSILLMSKQQKIYMAITFA